jgi:Protein of unknown function (DUF3108)
MTIASFLPHRRRMLLFCVATAVLHGLAIDWAANRLAASATIDAPPSLVSAQVRLTLPPRVASTPLVDVAALAPDAKPAKPAAKPATPPRTAALPPPSAVPAAATSDGAITPVTTEAPAPVLDAADPALATAPAPAAAASPAPVAADQPAPQGGRRYKVQLPPSATFEMDVARVDADGTKWTGSAVMAWHTDGSTYRASVEAGVSLLVTRLNLLVLRSEGTIDDHGIAPDRSTEKRARRAETATHFNRSGERSGTISFSASDRSFPLLAGAQDKATVPFQLAGIGRADINQFGGDIDIQVGEDKAASLFRFQLVGEDELNTKMGKLVTWHLTRPPMPGTYSSRLDIWLAPGMQWYPVQMRNTEASGALTTQTISNIKITGQ